MELFTPHSEILLLLEALFLIVNVLQMDVNIILSSKSSIIFIILGLRPSNELLGMILSLLLMRNLIHVEDFMDIIPKVSEERLLSIPFNALLSLVLMVLNGFFEYKLQIYIPKLALLDLRV